MTKRPAFQFYPGDWLRDTGLRSCSAAARGLWMDILCFMHKGSPYGYLKLNRRFVGSELKESYFKQACQNLKNAKAQLDLFA